jgi:hypothetical protein
MGAQTPAAQEIYLNPSISTSQQVARKHARSTVDCKGLDILPAPGLLSRSQRPWTIGKRGGVLPRIVGHGFQERDARTMATATTVTTLQPRSLRASPDPLTTMTTVMTHLRSVAWDVCPPEIG